MINKKLNFSYINHLSNPLINKKILKKNSLIATKKIKHILKNIDKEKNVFHSFSKKFNQNVNTKNLKKFNKFEFIAIVGIGGSILGAKAINQFLKQKIRKTFFFFDNLDEENFKNILNKKKFKRTLFLIISKSGNTIETLANLSLLTKYKINPSNTIIVTEKKNSALSNFSKKRNILIVEHKKYIGGRYSVLSEVGMLPAYFMNLRVNSFKKNSLDFLSKKKSIFLNDSASKLAQYYLAKKYNSLVFLNYCPQLEHFLFWCQQLIAESLGKKNKGFLPIVSIAPRDHHSLLQLYLDGPKDKLFYIFSSTDLTNLRLNKNLFGKEFKFLDNKNLNKIVNSQKDALTKSLKKKKIPFREFQINNFSEECAGELFSYFMLETVLIAELVKINPFDQSAVEDIKIITKKLLS